MAEGRSYRRQNLFDFKHMPDDDMVILNRAAGVSVVEGDLVGEVVCEGGVMKDVGMWGKIYGCERERKEVDDKDATS